MPKRERNKKPQIIGSNRKAEVNLTQNPLLFMIFYTFQAPQGPTQRHNLEIKAETLQTAWILILTPSLTSWVTEGK